MTRVPTPNPTGEQNNLSQVTPWLWDPSKRRRLLFGHPVVVILKVWSVDRQHQHPQGTRSKFRFTGPAPVLLIETLWGQSPVTDVLTSPHVIDSAAIGNLRCIALQDYQPISFCSQLPISILVTCS